jgi:chemotaxis signal transduction protein
VRGAGERGSTVALLRRQFDESFALPYQPPPAPYIDLLSIRLGGRPHALRQDQMSGLFAGRPVVALPSSQPHLLGLAGVRGVLVPVFALAALVGADAPGERPHWLVLCGRDEPIGLAFQELDRYVRVPLTAIHRGGEGGSPAGPEGGAGHAIALVEGEPLVLLDVPEILAGLRRTRGADPAKER